MGKTRSTVSVWLCVSLAGCTGAVMGPDSTKGPNGNNGPPPAESTSEFTCEAGLVPDAVPLRRLSKVQLQNTARDLLSFALPDNAAEQAEVFEEVTALFDAIPDDQRLGPNGRWGGFSRVDQVVNQEHVERGYEIASRIGEALSTGNRLATVAGACATDGDAANDAGCLDAFIRRFGERSLRRAVTDEDVTFYAEVAGEAPFEAADWADVMALLMTAPHALYFVEHGDAEVDADADLYAMDAYELASRLSYHFWQSAPDDELFALARSGELLEEDTYTAQVRRMFADPRTKEVIHGFYAEWFERDDVMQMNARVGTPAFDTLRGDFTPSSLLRDAMFTEVADMATYYSLEVGGTLEDIYTSTKSFARTEELASIYDVPVWDGTSEPPEFTQPRSGLLTRAAMVASGSANTRPIMKGVFIRRALLCDTLNPPPANVMAAVPIDVTADMSAREKVSELTETRAECRGCHAMLINGLGFATENFDSLGRFRDEEMLIDVTSGDLVGTESVNTAAVPRVTTDDADEIPDARALQDAMLHSGKLDSCFARSYFRFTFGRAEDVTRDGCALASMHGSLVAGEPLEDVLERIALSPAFRQRNFGE